MKQRLGLAAALLSDPDLVILDEPTNGLDPQGIQEMRVFIRELADKHGKTVFLSSHMLNEVEQVCDRVAIINNGQLVEQGSVSEILSREEQLRIEVDLPDQAAAILGEHWTVNPNGTALLVSASREDAPTIAEKLVANQIKIYELAKHRRTLEEHFLLVTKGEDQNAG
jgi:ABC-2 type transport system ATP-binding protein